MQGDTKEVVSHTFGLILESYVSIDEVVSDQSRYTLTESLSTTLLGLIG